MDEQELQLLVEHISMKEFARPFQHRASFNSRLRTTGGRYHLKTHYLDFNPKVIEVMGIEGLIGVIIHELCHYHLHLMGKGHKHRDQDFKEMLAATGGLRYVPLLSDSLYKWDYVCLTCKTSYRRKRRMNTKKYACGVCKGKLEESPITR